MNNKNKDMINEVNKLLNNSTYGKIGTLQYGNSIPGGAMYAYMADTILKDILKNDEITNFVDSLVDLPLEEAMAKLEYYKAGLIDE